MTRSLRRFLSLLAASMAFALPASATTYSTDYTDLWFNPSESGWGVNVIQQSDTMFATLFVYGADNSARWYVASATVPASSGNQTLFSGPLYQTTGPYFGGAFNPASVVVTQVGSMTFNFTSSNSGTLTYSVNGVNVTKSITRQTFKNNNLGGHYLGGLIGISSACNGVGAGDVLVFGTTDVQHSGAQQVTMTIDFVNTGNVAVHCTFNAPYSQAGKMGALSGTWGCTFNGGSPTNGSFSVSQIDATLYGWAGRFNGNDQYCTYNGNFGMVRDVH
jgi:hypothetical protein